jgi:hypothetical protein
MNIVLALDSDEAGRKHSEEIKRSYAQLYNIKERLSPEKDWGDISVSKIKEIFNV